MNQETTKMDELPVDENQTPGELIFRLDDKPSFGITLLAAVQHILAIILSVMAPPAIVAQGLGLPTEAMAYLISMSLFIAGIGIWLQVSRPFGIGSGMLSIQATSFVFPGTLVSVGTYLLHQKGMAWEEMLSTLLGVCFIGGIFVMLGSLFMKMLQKIITPTVAGVTVLMIGLSLIKVGAIDFGGGSVAKKDGTFGDPHNLFLGAVTLLVIIVCNRSKNNLLRMSALVIGMITGFILAAFMGMVHWELLREPFQYFVIPIPFKYGFFGFDWHAFIILFFPFLTVIIEAIGDLTATSAVSEQPVSGPLFEKRIKGGILCDGLMTSIGAVLCCFPVATFSQNNGIIQLSGVASRKVGKFCGVLFIVFALFPVVVLAFKLLPRPVLGGALIMLFGTIACSGIRILLQHHINRRESIIVAASVSVGVMSMVTPDVFHQLPQVAQVFFDSAIVSGGVTAMLVNLILPKKIGIAPNPREDLKS